MRYKIIAISAYGREVVDEAASLAEAKRLAQEYRIAFGPSFTITIQ